VSTLREEIHRRHVTTPIDAEPIIVGAKQRAKTQPRARCECGAWLSMYRKPGDTLCAPCQRRRGA
jgi:hypothetical protein